MTDEEWNDWNVSSIKTLSVCEASGMAVGGEASKVCKKGAVKMTSNFVNIENAIKNYLDEDGWHYEMKEDEEVAVFHFTLTVSGKIRELQYFVEVHEDGFSSIAVFPVNADIEDKQMMAEFLHRANYSLREGNFEFDFRDGEIHYKCFIDCDGGIIPTKSMVRNSVLLPYHMYMRFVDGILGIIFNQETGKDAIEKCKS